MDDSRRVLQGVLSDFRLSNNPTAKGAALDQIAWLAASGDSHALRELVKITLEMRLAEKPVRSVLLDPADVDDAVQATLIAVATKIGTFEGTSSFKTWVHTVAKNEALSVVRRRKRKSEPELIEVPEQDFTARRLSSLLADEDVYARSLSSLSSEHQEVLRLREELGLSYSEISRRLGITHGTVCSRISRARRLLAESIVSVDPDRSDSDG